MAQTQPLPTIAAVLPNYNHERYLPFSLEGICSQSVPPKEVFVVDDASTDGSVAVIQEFARRYPFVRLIRNERNIGCVNSFRRGWEEVTADCVTFPAADDLLLPGLFEKSLKMLQRYPQAGLCSSLVGLLSPDGKDLGPYETSVISQAECYVPPERYVETYREHENWILSYSAIYRSPCVKAVGMEDPELGPPADAVMGREIAMRFGSCFIPERLAMWRPPVSGSFSQNIDFNMAVELHDRIAKRLREPAGRAPTKDELEYLALWSRRIELEHLGLLLEEKPTPYGQIAIVLGRIPHPSPVERALLAMVRSPLRLKAPLKLYHFASQRPAERRRILRRKLGLK
ncbi:MAG: glycosyltransferase family A protein [Elusimicrobia bacterium]|nr:glycosyltransferase family A protein [Elusimicrobiota bacterium]